MTWQCGKCDGADVPAHSRHCPKHDPEENVTVVDWALVHQLQRRAAPRDDDASQATTD